MHGTQRRKKIQRHGLIPALMLALVIALTGCGDIGKPDGAPDPNQAAGESKNAGLQSAKQTSYPLKLKDSTGTELAFDKAPERIVTLAPSETETVFAVGAGDKVVGVDKWSDYPEEAKKKPQIGDLKTNIEAVVAAKPDVVFASSSMNKKAVEELRGLNVKVYASDPATIDQVIEKVERIGEILNLQEDAAKVAEGMRNDKQKVADAVKNAPKKRVYFEFSPGWTVGDGEFLSEMIALAGGVNTASGKTGYFQIDPEAVVKANPEIILYSRDDAGGMGSILDEIKKRPGWDGVDALKNNRVVAIESSLTNRVGPRVTKGLLEMAKAIYPDLVN